MNLDRRGFLRGQPGSHRRRRHGAGTSAATLPDPKQPGVLRLSSQLSRIPGESLEEKMEKMKKWGFEAAELPGDIVGKEKKYEDALRNTGVDAQRRLLGFRQGPARLGLARGTKERP